MLYKSLFITLFEDLIILKTMISQGLKFIEQACSKNKLAVYPNS